jgi:hypothetical protein
MKADVVQYTYEEGGNWIDWPFHTFKPSNPELKTMGFQKGTNHGKPIAMFGEPMKGFGIFVHSLKLSDGREWDCVNGFRPEKK